MKLNEFATILIEVSLDLRLPRSISEEVRDKNTLAGLKNLKIDGILSQLMGTLISGAFTVPLLVTLGASSFHIGLYSAVISLMTVSQLFSYMLVKKSKSRKMISVISSLLARSILFLLGLFLLWGLITNVVLFLLVLSLFYFISNVSSGSFKYWMLDFVPKKIRGDYFANRMRDALIISSLIGSLVAIYIDSFGGGSVKSYDLAFLIASFTGLIGVYFLSRVPEPTLRYHTTFNLTILKETMGNADIRKHLRAIFLIYLAINISFPFYVYYMISRLGLSILYVFLFTILGQISTILSLPKWGSLIDRFGAKPVLKFSVRAFAVVLLLWPFTTLPDKYFFSIILVGLIYVLTGLVIGGLNLSSSLISYSLVIDEKKNISMSLNDIFIGLGSLTGSILGALLSIPSRFMELSLTFNLFYPEKLTFYFIDLKGLDFLFVLSSVLMLLLSPFFSKYRLEKSVDEEKNYVELVVGIRRYIRSFKNSVLIVNGKINKNRRTK